MLKKISIAVYCMLIIFSTTAQNADAVAELQKIRAYYAGSELKHVAGEMLLKNQTTGKTVDKVNFEYWAEGKKIFAKMNFIEILSNDEVYIMVNHKRKTIYGRYLSQLTQKPNIGFFDPEQLGKALNAKWATVKLNKEGIYNKLTLSGLQNSNFTSFTITYNVDYKIIGIEANVNATPNSDKPNLLLQIKYTKSEKSIALKESLVFSASKYIEKQNKRKYIYTKNYKDYQKL